MHLGEKRTWLSINFKLFFKREILQNILNAFSKQREQLKEVNTESIGIDLFIYTTTGLFLFVYLILI